MEIRLRRAVSRISLLWFCAELANGMAEKFDAMSEILFRYRNIWTDSMHPPNQTVTLPIWNSPGVDGGEGRAARWRFSSFDGGTPAAGGTDTDMPGTVHGDPRSLHPQRGPQSGKARGVLHRRQSPGGQRRKSLQQRPPPRAGHRMRRPLTQ